MTTILQLDTPVSLGDACQTPRRIHSPSPPVADACQAVVQALAQPVGFPPLSQAVVPGDQVAVALGPGLPDLAAIAAGMVEGLMHAGVEPDHIALVTATQADAQPLQQISGDRLPAGVRVVVHDPTDDDALCFAGVTKEDDVSLMLNRTLFDADMMIPVTCARATQDRDSRGVYSGLYPTFTDKACRKLFLKTADERNSWWAKRTEEAGWLIGAPLVVQVTPGQHGQVASVVAGDPDQTAQAAAQSATQHWSCQMPEPAMLVIATLSGDPQRQTWDDLARALAAAESAVAPDGAIAICSHLGGRLGRSLTKLREAADAEHALHQLDGDAHADTWAARQLAATLTRGPVFLLSRWSEDVVEDLGLGCITSTDQLQRLASRFESVVLLEDADLIDLTTGGQL